VNSHAQRIDLVRSDEHPGMEGVHDHSRDAAGADALAPGWHVWEATAARQPQILSGCWDEFVSATEGHVTQTAEWVEYALATDYERAVLLAGIGESGAPHSLAVGFITVPRWPLRSLPKIRFPAYPSIGEDPGRLGEAVAVCERVARARQCIAIEFAGAGQPGLTPVLGPLGYVTRDRTEYFLDLTQGEEALFAQLKRSHRRNVRRSARFNVRVMRMDSAESVHIVRRLQSDVTLRRAARGDAFGLRPPEHYEALHQALVARGLGRVYCASLDGSPVSAGLFLTFGGRALSLYQGTNEQGLAFCGGYGAYWHAVAELSREGFAELLLGTDDLTAQDPDSPAHGLHQFKLGFGARTRPVAAASKQLRPTAFRAHRVLRRLSSALGGVRRALASPRAGGQG
jgi:hypothetical protein